MRSKSMIKAMTAYGLRDFPYLRRELNPVRDGHDLDLWCPVDGWRLAESLGDFVASRGAAKKPALVVIAGGSGTGRTSLANYVIHRWATARQEAPDFTFDPEKLIVERSRMTHYDAAKHLWTWALEVHLAVQNAGYESTESIERAFTALAEKQPEAIEASLGLALGKLTGALSAGGWSLASVIEDVREQALLTLAEKSLHFVDSLLVTTVEATAGNFDAVLADVESALDQEISRLVTLGELNGSEARQVVFKRWQICTENDPPFKEQDVENAFVNRPRPIARILKLMELLLVVKVADEHLKFREGEMVDRIEALDDSLFAGR